MDILKTVLSAAGGFLIAFAIVYLTCSIVTKIKRNRNRRKSNEQSCGIHEKKHDAIINKIDVILILVGGALVAFTLKMIDLFETYMIVPDTLITCVFTVCGGEFGVLGWIKTSKEKYRERKWQLEDEKRMEEAAKRAASGESSVNP